ELIDPAGNVVASQAACSSCYFQVPEIDKFVLTAAGDYTIRITESGHDARGAFVIGVSDQAAAPPTQLPALNTTITGALSPLGDVDEYRCGGAAGNLITVERLSSNFDLPLLGPGGGVVAGSGNFDNLLQFVSLPQDGEYVLRIEPHGSSLSSELDDV